MKTIKLEKYREVVGEEKMQNLSGKPLNKSGEKTIKAAQSEDQYSKLARYH